MKNIFKKNQMIITALAIMIAVAGYLNYSGSKLDSASLSADSDSVTQEDADVASDISAEDLYAATGLEELQFAEGDIVSLDQDAEDLAAADSSDVTAATETAELDEDEEPGEAVLASTSVTSGVSIAAEAKLNREQTRSKNREILQEIIDNASISDVQKQEAIDALVELTDISERESAAELLLTAKGFEDVVVSITDSQADVVVNMTDVDDAGRAQIEDIVTRKTGISGENIVITPVAVE